MNAVPVEKLYHNLITAWNERNATYMASLFMENGSIVGFDGSQMNSSAEIKAELTTIFAHHETSAFVSKIREIRFLSPDTALLRAVVGMTPPGKKYLNPDVNAIQVLIAVHHQGHWRIAHFQNTPAQFHGKPELRDALTKELQELL